MMHSKGISYEGDVLDLAMLQKMVIRSGAWFRYGDVQLGQGREKTRQYLEENPQLVEELKNKIMAVGVATCRGKRRRRRQQFDRVTRYRRIRFAFAVYPRQVSFAGGLAAKRTEGIRHVEQNHWE